MPSDTKILIVSLGSIGKRHLRNARRLLPDAQIAVYRQHTRGNKDIPDGANQLFLTLDEALDFKPNAVINASPASEHIKTSMPFLRSGTHLFLEKPLTQSSDELDGFLELVETSPSFLMVGYVLRFLPILSRIRQKMQDGDLGKVLTARVEVGQFLPDWRPDSDYRAGVSAQRKLGGGVLLELSHELDYTLWLFGRPDLMQASISKISTLEIDVEDNAHLIFEYGSASRTKTISIQLDFLQRAANMELQIVGENGTLKADLMRETAHVFDSDNPDGVKLEMPKSADGNEIYLRQFDFFFSKCLDEYRPMFPETVWFADWVDAAHGAEIVRLVEFARQASISGQRQTLSASVS